MLTEEIGIVSAVTGAGKTEMMAGIIKLLRCPTIVITEQLVVLDQIVERLKIRKTVFKDDIGMFCHGQMPDGNVVIVGSIQSLVPPAKPPKKPTLNKKKVFKQIIQWMKSDPGRLGEIFPEELVNKLLGSPKQLLKLRGTFYTKAKKYVTNHFHGIYVKAWKSRRKKSKKLQEMAKRCDMLLVDECDKASAMGYRKFVRYWFDGRRRYGFSGTPFDKSRPVESLFVRELFGSIIAKASRRYLEGIGRIIPVTYNMFTVGNPANRRDKTAYDIAVKEQLILNESFHKMVAKIISGFPDDRTLVLVDTSPIEQLGRLLETLIENSKFIFGKTSTDERWKYINAFGSGDLRCLIGSKILKRGLDLKQGCHNLILVGGGALWSDLDQKVGRAVRNNGRGKARVFDFFFYDNHYLYRHSRERLKCAVSLGYKTRVIFGNQELDGAKFVKSRFRIPKSVRIPNPTPSLF